MTSLDYKRAGAALADVEEVADWKTRDQFGKATVEWQWGSATTGYRQLQAEISAIVTERMLELRDEAIRRIQARADEAVAACQPTARPEGGSDGQ